MAIVVSSPEHSFVNFTPSEVSTCNDSTEVCLPVASLEDLNFMLLATGDTTNLLTNNTGGLAYIVSICRTCEDEISCNYFNRIMWGISGEVEGNKTGIVNTETIDSTDFDALAEGDCFKLCLFKVEWPNGDTIPSNLCNTQPSLTVTNIGCSQCFVKQTDICYTTLVKYRSSEDSMGFTYTGNTDLDLFFNKIRLPMYLKQPQYQSSRNVYRKSNGDLVKLSSTMSELWQVDTDYLTKDLHKKLAIALEHDSLYLSNDNSGAEGFYLFEDVYDVKWQDFLDMDTAKASFKIKTTPFNISNSNCS